MKRFVEKRLRFKIDLTFPLPYDVVGRIEYGEMHIGINALNNKEALLAILHETGHAIGFLRFGKTEEIFESTVHIYRRELYAYLYGWCLIKRFNLPVSKKQWRDENLEYIQQFKP